MSSSLARGAGVVGGATLVSRLTGMVRDMVIAAWFDRMATDVFFTAFTIPNVLRRLLGEGSLTSVLVPVYTEVQVKQGEAPAKRFVGAAFGTGLAVLLGVTALGILLSPWIVMAYAWGFQSEPGKFSLCVSLTRFMWPYLVFVGLCAIAMGVLNAHRRFFWPAFSQTLFNLSMIGTTILAAGWLESHGIHPIWSLAIGVLAGGALQFASQIVPLRRIDRLPRPRLERHPEVTKVAKLLGPSVIGLGIYQLDILLSRLFASLLPEGSVTYLYYCMRLVELPQAVFVMAIAAAALPDLSLASAKGETDALKRTYVRSLTMSSFVAVPSVVGLAVLAVPVVAVLFQRGAFTWEMTGHTADALVWIALGIPGVAGVRNTSPVFYALQDTRTPVKMSALSLVLYIGLCLALMGPWKHVGIAAAIAAAPTAQFLAQVVFLRRKIGALGLRAAFDQLWRHLASAGVMVAACLPVASLGRWSEGGTLRNTLVLAAALLAGGATYAAAAWVFGARDARALLDGLRRRLRRRAA
ncbi:MAG: murein biosynthesis integral membrane protein MurJ [Myxococcales bacterium]|nr:murein biosynthesis integral membrane protein MurJ [Myxococcales bacterium]